MYELNPYWCIQFSSSFISIVLITISIVTKRICRNPDLDLESYPESKSEVTATRKKSMRRRNQTYNRAHDLFDYDSIQVRLSTTGVATTFCCTLYSVGCLLVRILAISKDTFFFKWIRRRRKSKLSLIGSTPWWFALVNLLPLVSSGITGEIC